MAKRIYQGVNGHKKTWARPATKLLIKTYTKYKQRELNEKGEKTGKALGKHAIDLYSTGISRVFKIRDVKKLQHDIENVRSLKIRWLTSFVFQCVPKSEQLRQLAHTVNNLDLDDEQGLENEGYESD